MPNYPTKRFFALACMLFLAGQAHGAHLYSALSQDSITVGDRVRLRVTIICAPGADITPPETDDGFGEIVVKEWAPTRTSRGNSDSVDYDYVITAYTTGICTLTTLPFVVANGDATDTLSTDQKLLRVFSVITGDTVDIQDLRAPQSAGKPSLTWLWVLLGAAGAVGLIFLGRHLWLQSRKPPPPPPPVPPYEEALSALASLEGKNYLTKGLVREYVFELSEILKRYIGRRYDANIAEATTEEVEEWLTTSPLNKHQKLAMAWFFSSTHPIKFAKLIPDDVMVKRLLGEVKDLLEQTRPDAEISAEETDS